MDDFHDEPLKLEIDPLFLKNQATRTRTSKYPHLLRKALVLLLPMSLLSLLLTFFTGVSFLQSYTYYFSTFLFPLLTQALERKYMFLLCNGILVFLAAGKSGFCSAVFSSPPPTSRLQGEAETSTIEGSEKGAQTAEVIEDQEGELDENKNESIGVSRGDHDTESKGPANRTIKDRLRGVIQDERSST